MAHPINILMKVLEKKRKGSIYPMVYIFHRKTNFAKNIKPIKSANYTLFCKQRFFQLNLSVTEPHELSLKYCFGVA